MEYARIVRLLRESREKVSLESPHYSQRICSAALATVGHNCRTWTPDFDPHWSRQVIEIGVKKSVTFKVFRAIATHIYIHMHTLRRAHSRVWVCACICMANIVRACRNRSRRFAPGHWQFYVIIWCVRTASRICMRRNRGREKFVFYQRFMSWNVLRANRIDVTARVRSRKSFDITRGVISARAKRGADIKICCHVVYLLLDTTWLHAIEISMTRKECTLRMKEGESSMSLWRNQ